MEAQLKLKNSANIRRKLDENKMMELENVNTFGTIYYFIHLRSMNKTKWLQSTLI